MSDKEVFYLRPNAVVEPLFNQWYAWGMLIPPQTASMFTSNLHTKIMRSYVMAPMAHAAAVKNPAMLGGPYIDYQGKRVDEIRALLEKTERELSYMFEFSRAVKELNALLAQEATGYTMEPLYEKIPEGLRGYVELVYDLLHRPSVRFIEPLLYESEYYRPELQSFSLSLIDGDYRPFVFSTPRLEDAEHFHLRLPFAHAGMDELFRMREVPRPLGDIREQLGLDEGEADRLKPFLTTEAPAPPTRFDGAGVRIRYMGHACVLVETSDVSIIVDPCVSYDYENGLPRFTFRDLPETIDYVLLTHNHQDHVLLEMLFQLRYKVKHVVVPRAGGGSLQDPSLKLMLQKAGFKSVLELGELEKIEVPGGHIMGLPFLGEHGDLDIRGRIAHMMNLRNRSILCAADTCNIDDRLYERLAKVIGRVDTLFIGMEASGAPVSYLYGPLYSNPIDRKLDQTRRLCGSNFERGIRLVERYRCEEAYVYALGQEPWLNYFMAVNYDLNAVPIVESDKFVSECRRRGIASERLFAQKELVYDPA